MSLPLFLGHLRAHRPALIVWAGLLGFWGFALVGSYPFFKGALVADVLFISVLPEPMQEAIIGAPASTFFTPEGDVSLIFWITGEYLSYWPMLVAIYAIFFAGGIAATEFDRGTLSLILSQPLPRHQFVASKFGVFLVSLTLMALASLVGLLSGLLITGEEARLGGLLAVLGQGALLVVAVGGYSLLLSCLFLEPRRTLIAASLITFGLYLLDFLSPLLGDWQWLQSLSLFSYYRAAKLLQQAGLSSTGVIIYIGVAMVSLALSLFTFQRRNLAY